MKVSVTIAPLAGLPAPVGAHELAWSYLLDAVMADAYTRELAVLHVVLPQPLGAAVTLRAKLGTQSPQVSGGRTGVALFGSSPSLPEGTTRLYRLTFGYLASFTSPCPTPLSGSWHLTQQLSIYCLPAYLWGGLIRVANFFGNRALSDWAMYRMRQSFARRYRHPAFYQLTIWERS